MEQMYLLTVIVNLWVGFAFILPWLSEKYPIFSDFKGLTDKIPLQVKLGFSIFVLALGLVKMLLSYNIVLVGDLFPSLTLILASIVLFGNVLKEKPDTLSLSSKWMDLIEKVREKQVIIGFLCIAAGVLHFLIPKVIFF